MTASINDKITKVGLPGSATTLASPGYTMGAGNINLTSSTNWETTTAVHFDIFTTEISGNEEVEVANTRTSWKAVLSGTTLSSLQLEYGTDQNYAAGTNTKVVITPSTIRENEIADHILTEHDQDGTHKSSAVSVYNPAGMLAQFAGASAPTGWLLCQGTAVSRTTYSSLFSVIGTTYGSGDGSATFNLPDLRGRSPVGSGTGTFAETVTSANVNTSTDQFTVSTAGGRQLTTGTLVTLSTSGTAPTGLTASTSYYVIAVDSTHIKLANNRANAIAGTAIDITGTGSGNHTLTMSFTAKTLGEYGGEETHSLTATEIPAHTHTLNLAIGPASNAMFHNSNGTVAAGDGGTSGSKTTDSGGGSSGAHNIMQPYVALNYIIKT